LVIGLNVQKHVEVAKELRRGKYFNHPSTGGRNAKEIYHKLSLAMKMPVLVKYVK
jgi:hypothetical protein